MSDFAPRTGERVMRSSGRRSRTHDALRLAQVASLISLGACVTASGPRSARTDRLDALLPAAQRLSRSVADTVTSEPLASGVVLHRLVSNREPWRAFVLDIDRSAACVSVRALKGGSTAVGRTATTALLASIADAEVPIAAVNADFFLFAPPGVPVGAHIERGRLISGPIGRPVFAVLDGGRPFVGRASATVRLTTSRGVLALPTWNRPTRGVPGLVDAAWGVALDSTLGTMAWRLVPVVPQAVGSRPVGVTDSARYVASSFTRTAGSIARGDTMFVVEIDRSAYTSEAAALRDGDTVTVTRSIDPAGVREMVGGFPVLLSDSAIVGDVDSVSNAGFRGLNPRTALGIAARGNRLFIVVIDGRQSGYSVGMSLRETAALMRALGARDAINLDGGGSSAMAVVHRDTRGARETGPTAIRLVNRVSDAVGERPVANALAVVGSCESRPIRPG